LLENKIQIPSFVEILKKSFLLEEKQHQQNYCVKTKKLENSKKHLYPHKLPPFVTCNLLLVKAVT
jgi:hypothetical protein